MIWNFISMQKFSSAKTCSCQKKLGKASHSNFERLNSVCVCVCVCVVSFTMVWRITCWDLWLSTITLIKRALKDLRALLMRVIVDNHKFSVWSSRPWWITHTHTHTHTHIHTHFFHLAPQSLEVKRLVSSSPLHGDHLRS